MEVFRNPWEEGWRKTIYVTPPGFQTYLCFLPGVPRGRSTPGYITHPLRGLFELFGIVVAASDLPNLTP